MQKTFTSPTEIDIFKRVTENYIQNKRCLEFDDFLNALKEKREVTTTRNTFVVSYNLDRTKLYVKRYFHKKEYKLVKGKNILNSVITKHVFGLIFDLKRYNVTHYSKGNMKGKKNVCRINLFTNGLYMQITDILMHLSMEIKTNIITIVKDHIKNNTDENDLGNIVRAFYFNNRRIDYFNNRGFLQAFCRYFIPNRSKYDGKNIYEITADLIKIKNIDYIKYFYEGLDRTLKNKTNMIANMTINLHHLKLIDMYDVPIQCLDDNPEIWLTTTHCPHIKEIKNTTNVINKLQPIYHFRYTQLLSEPIISKLEILIVLYRFGYMLNIENLKTITRIDGELQAVLQLLLLSFNDTGAYIMSNQSVQQIRKYFGKNYKIYPGFSPDTELRNRVVRHFDCVSDLTNQVSSTSLNVLDRKKNSFTINLDNIRDGTCDLSKNTVEHQPKLKKTTTYKKITTFINYFNNDCKNIKTELSFKYVFSEKYFIDLCEKNNINYKRYLTKLRT